MYELYILKNLTINEIGEIYGVKYKRVTEILKKLGIKKSKEARVKNSINRKRKLKENDPNYGLSEANKNITRDVLYNAYVIQDMSIEDCGKFFGTSVTSIHRLCKKFSFLERQYFSIVYPFACDFYIPELDLYIEYQGHFSHGKEPFDPHKEEHIKKVELWKSKNKRSYNDAINVWTVRDPLKRETARKNNLNWIEFFTMDEFMEWYNAC